MTNIMRGVDARCEMREMDNGGGAGKLNKGTCKYGLVRCGGWRMGIRGLGD